MNDTTVYVSRDSRSRCVIFWRVRVLRRAPGDERRPGAYLRLRIVNHGGGENELKVVGVYVPRADKRRSFSSSKARPWGLRAGFVWFIGVKSGTLAGSDRRASASRKSVRENDKLDPAALSNSARSDRSRSQRYPQIIHPLRINLIDSYGMSRVEFAVTESVMAR